MFNLFRSKSVEEVSIKEPINVAVIGNSSSGKSTIIEIVTSMLEARGIQVNVFSKDIYNKVISETDNALDYDEWVNVKDSIRVYNNDVGTGTKFFSDEDISVRLHELKFADMFTLNKQLIHADKVILVQEQNMDSALINLVSFKKDSTLIVFNKFVDSKLKLKHFYKVFGADAVHRSIVTPLDQSICVSSIDSLLAKELMDIKSIDKGLIHNIFGLVEWLLDGGCEENVV